MDKNASFAEANARRIRIIKANGNSGCKSTAFVSFPIKSSNGERCSSRSLHSNCDKNVVSKEIAVLGGEVLERNGKETPRPEGARRCYLSGPEVFLVLSASGSFLRASFSARCGFQFRSSGRRCEPKFHRIIRRDSGSSGNNPQSVLVE